jgi:hypothetical protein
MTAVLALGETPQTARYRTHDPEAVGAFLARYPFLVPLLTEALGPLGEAFCTDTPLIVAVETDPEVGGLLAAGRAHCQPPGAGLGRRPVGPPQPRGCISDGTVTK